MTRLATFNTRAKRKAFEAAHPLARQPVAQSPPARAPFRATDPRTALRPEPFRKTRS